MVTTPTKPSISTPDSQADDESKSRKRRSVTLTRRRLSPDQQREVVRLYSSTNASVADISKQYGIGESSVYRFVQLQGVTSRGRASRGSESGSAVDGQTATPASPTRRGTKPASASNGHAPRSAAAAAVPVGTRRFEITFASVQDIDARDVDDAIRQVQRLGATDIKSIERL